MQLDYSQRRIRSLSQIPDSDLNQATEVTELILNDNPILDFEGLEKFSNLHRLSLDNTRITSLPAEIAELPSLSHLSCEGNIIKSIPEWLGGLTSLKVINLGANEIEEVPPVFAKLGDLEELYLDYNKIDFLSGELIHQLSRLKKLKIFETKGNKDLPVDQKVLLGSEPNEEPEDADLNPVSITDRLDLFSEYYKGPMGALNQVKVVILGGGGVGKSTLVEAIVEGKAPTNTTSTTSVNIQDWKPSIYIQGGEVTVSIWDFGGQQIFHDISKIFLSDDTIYVILDDIQNADGDPRHGVKYWLRHIKGISKEERKSPVIVAFHRADTKGIENYVSDLSEELARDFGVKRCLCTSKERPETLEEFEQFLKEEVRKLAQQRDAVPLYFIKTRDRLLKLEEPYITRKKLRGIIQLAKAEMDDDEIPKRIEDLELDSCIKFLHRIGAMVRIADPLNNRTYILKPKWLVEGIYGLFNSPLVKKDRGRFTRELVLDDPDSFHHQQDYNWLDMNVIIDAMLAFKLAFKVRRNDDREAQAYLIPAHLGRKPNETYLL